MSNACDFYSCGSIPGICGCFDYNSCYNMEEFIIIQWYCIVGIVAKKQCDKAITMKAIN